MRGPLVVGVGRLRRRGRRIEVVAYEFGIKFDCSSECVLWGNVV